MSEEIKIKDLPNNFLYQNGLKSINFIARVTKRGKVRLNIICSNSMSGIELENTMEEYKTQLNQIKDNVLLQFKERQEKRHSTKTKE